MSTPPSDAKTRVAINPRQLSVLRTALGHPRLRQLFDEDAIKAPRMTFLFCMYRMVQGDDYPGFVGRKHLDELPTMCNGELLRNEHLQQLMKSYQPGKQIVCYMFCADQSREEYACALIDLCDGGDIALAPDDDLAAKEANVKDNM